MIDLARAAFAIALMLCLASAQAQDKGTSATATQTARGGRGRGGQNPGGFNRGGNRGQQAPALGSASGIVVLNVGDSITQGVGQAGNYSTPLAADLGTSYSVVPAGISGATYTRTNHRDYRTSRQYQRAIVTPANIVTIMLGTNDAKINAADAAQDVWPAAKESYKRDVEDLIRRFKYLPTAPRVFVCVPIPASNDNKYSSKGDTIRDMVIPVLLEAATEEEVGIIDMWHTELLGQTGDGTSKGQGTEPSKLYQDGVHPNMDGNKIVADKLASILKLPQPVIAVDGRKLSVSTEGAEYKWFRNGLPVPAEEGGNMPALEAKASGMYAVAVMPSKQSADRLMSQEIWVK